MILQECPFAPDVSGYDLEWANYVVTPTDVPAPIQWVKPLYRYKADIVTASWSLDQLDYWDFCTFFQDRVDAVEPFLIELITKKRIQYKVIAWFKEDTFILSRIAGRMFTCNCQLEVLQNG